MASPRNRSNSVCGLQSLYDEVNVGARRLDAAVLGSILDDHCALAHNNLQEPGPEVLRLPDTQWLHVQRLALSFSLTSFAICGDPDSIPVLLEELIALP